MEFRKFYYGDEEIVAFMDESGDEAMKDPSNPVFVFGCCFVRGRDLGALRQSWLDVREVVLGDRMQPMHMRELILSADQDVAIQKFFTGNQFYRSSVAVTDRTLFELGAFPFAPVLQVTLDLITQLIAQLISGAPSHGVSMVFEDSERLRTQFLQLFPMFRLNMDGIGMPVSWALLPKTENEPALEIADYIAHSTAGFMRHNRDQTSKFGARYRAIFHDAPYAKGWELNKCEFQGWNGQVPTQVPVSE